MRTVIAEIGCAVIFFTCMLLAYIGFSADDRRPTQVILYIETGIMQEDK